MATINSEILLNRFRDFGLRCQELTLLLPKISSNQIYGKQLIRSSSSPGANYIEAIEASSKKEFVLKLKICRRETKEAIYWLDLIKRSNNGIQNECDELIKEAQEFIKIFSSSILTSERNLAISNRK